MRQPVFRRRLLRRKVRQQRSLVQGLDSDSGQTENVDNSPGNHSSRHHPLTTFIQAVKDTMDAHEGEYEAIALLCMAWDGDSLMFPKAEIVRLLDIVFGLSVYYGTLYIPTAQTSIPHGETLQDSLEKDLGAWISEDAEFYQSHCATKVLHVYHYAGQGFIHPCNQQDLMLSHEYKQPCEVTSHSFVDWTGAASCFLPDRYSSVLTVIDTSTGVHTKFSKATWQQDIIPEED